jgi:hypothetical protein
MVCQYASVAIFQAQELFRVGVPPKLVNVAVVMQISFVPISSLQHTPPAGTPFMANRRAVFKLTPRPQFTQIINAFNSKAQQMKENMEKRGIFFIP